MRNRYWKERLPFIRSIAGIRDGWGVQQQTLGGHNDAVYAVTFSPDGKLVASGSYDAPSPADITTWRAPTSQRPQAAIISQSGYS